MAKPKKLKERLEDVLTSHFAGAELHWMRTPGNRLAGTMVWDGFLGQAQIDRQTQLRRVINESLPVDEQQTVSLILTLTPEENAALSEID